MSMAVDLTAPLPSAPGSQIPPSVSAFASAENLGRLQAVHVPKKAGWVPTIITLIMGLATVWLIVGLWFLWTAAKSPRLSRKQAAKRIYLFDNGFVYAETAERLTAYRWDQVATIYQFIQTTRANGVKLPTQYVYTITRLDGVSIKLTNLYGNIAQLGQRVSERILEVQLPFAYAALEQGRPLQFGAIVVNAGGIAAKGVELPWHSGSIHLHRGVVFVKRAGVSKSACQIPAREVPNLYVLLSVAAKYQTRAAGC
jgi:hypothetical protein